MPTMLQDRPVVARTAAPTQPTRRTGRLIAAGVGLAVVVPAGIAVHGWLDGLGGSLEPRTVDRSTTPLLLALDDLSEYHAATGTWQVMVDVERDTPWVPSAVSGERVSFLATGSADAYVDFETLDAGAVTLSPDGTSASIVLPAPRIGEVRVDPAESRVVDRDRGLLDRVGSAFTESPSDDSALFRVAEGHLADAADASDLLERAEDNTRGMLTRLATSLGVEDVEVQFEEPVGDGS
jgi:Protein of unknown function (DUF4230)